jgi:hypothetical protein
VNASGLLSRTSGVTTLSGGRDSEDYDAADSTGACYDHQIVAAQGWVKSDHILPSAELRHAGRAAARRPSRAKRVTSAVEGGLEPWRLEP